MDNILAHNEADLATLFGIFHMHVFQFKDSLEVALVHGSGEIPVVRVQSACLPSTVFSSTMCDCGEQIKISLSYLSSVDYGILIYLLDQESRGHGLLGKMEVMAQMNKGLSLNDAQILSGKAQDLRTYEKIPTILFALGISGEIDILSNSHKRVEEFRNQGLRIRHVFTL